MRKIKISFLLILISTVLLSCQPVNKNVRNKYPNLINYHFAPKNSKQTAVCFSDLGSWMGICLPDSSVFCISGPYILNEQQWVGKTLSKIKIRTDSDSDFFWGSSITCNSYPGLLAIDVKKENILGKIEAFFTSSQTFIQNIEIKNESSEIFIFNPIVEGSLFKPQTFRDNGIIRTKNGIIHFYIQDFNQSIFSTINDTSYIYFGNNVSLKPHDSYRISIVTSYYPDSTGSIINHIDAQFRTDSLFQENEIRWNNYLSNVVRNDLPEYDYIAVKCLQTLISNWKKPIGNLKHEGLVPSNSVSYFYGFWAWDSWKHAIAVVNFEPDLAKNQIRTMFDYQDSSGMIADCVFPDSRENNWRDTKPPLAGWAIWGVYQKTKDIAFLKEMLPKLEKYHRWWYKFRDHDQNGICEYGSTDGSLIAAKWESGMDNAVRFDSSVILQNAANSWSLNQESVDLNAYLYAEKNVLKLIHDELGIRIKSDEYNREAALLKQKIVDLFYDPNTKYFYDRKLVGDLMVTPGPEGLIPVWGGVLNNNQTKDIWEFINDPKTFNSYIPFPTISVSHPEYSTEGYWRGPVWLDQAYFAINGFRNHGMKNIADSLTSKIFANIEGLSGNTPIFENYDPLTGKGLNAPNFSWSAAHLLMMYLEYNR